MRVAVLASGGGSNLQSLLDAFAQSHSVQIALVISDRAAAGALERARNAGVNALHIRAADEDALFDALDGGDIDLIALAGYLRLVPRRVIERFRGRIVNVHPALLPAFGGPGMYGRRVHEAVLAAGCRVSGVTIHHVDERYDEGSIIAQWPVPVLDGDSADTLAARVLHVEHRLYPAVIATLAGVVPVTPHGALLEHDTFRIGALDGLDADLNLAIRTDGART
jgi:phosphoribosylglycinamide formyltransferase-1